MAADFSRSFKSPKNRTTKSTSVLVSTVLPPVANYFSLAKRYSDLTRPANSSACVSQHIDELRLAQSLVIALEVTVKQIRQLFTQGMRNSLAKVDIRALAQGLFVDAPIIEHSLSVIVCLASRIAAPLFSFPNYLSPHILEHNSRQSFSRLHTSNVALKVSFLNYECGIMFIERQFWPVCVAFALRM